MLKRTICISLGIACVIGVACGGPGGQSSSSDTSTGESTSPAVTGNEAKIIQVVERADIVSNGSSAKANDPDLKNAWGLAFSSLGTAWVSAAESGVSGVYNDDGEHVIPNVTIPQSPGLKPPSHPTGQVFNSLGGFAGDVFIFVSEDGVVSGWQPGNGPTPSTKAVLRADNSKNDAVYKGAGIAMAGGGARLYATDFKNGKIDVWDANYKAVDTAGKFVDGQIPAGFAPFNVQAIDGNLYVTYAKQSDEGDDDEKGPGNGFVNVFDTDGNLVSRLIQKGALNSPWGITVAPDGFGSIGGLLLVGNFGDGKINVYDRSGKQQGVLGKKDGKPIVVDGLWALQFGVDKGGFSSTDLYFTAGPNDEADGVFGELEVPEEPSEDGGADGAADAGGEGGGEAGADAGGGEAGGDAGAADGGTDGGGKTW